MNLGKLISGAVLSIGGVVLIIVAILNRLKGGSLVALIYGFPALVLGLVILLHKGEDKIEQIKRIKSNRGEKNE